MDLVVFSEDPRKRCTTESLMGSPKIVLQLPPFPVFRRTDEGILAKNFHIITPYAAARDMCSDCSRKVVCSGQALQSFGFKVRFRSSCLCSVDKVLKVSGGDPLY